MRYRDLIPALGEFTWSVRQGDYLEFGAVYRVEFNRQNPEFNPNLDDYALVNAQLTIPGRGRFLASDANAEARPCSNFRDWHQLTTGTRFLPAESAHAPR